MEEDIYIEESEKIYPALIIPRKCNHFDNNNNDNVVIIVNITSPDNEGNHRCIYSGFCNIKFIDSYDVNMSYMDINGQTDSIEDPTPGILNYANQPYTPYTQSQVWIDPARSPYVYNSHAAVGSQISHPNHITVEQHNTYITQNFYTESMQYSPPEEFEPKKLHKTPANDNSQVTDKILNENDEFENECGVFLAQPEEIMQDNETGEVRDEWKHIDLSENDALKQLMSSDILCLSKQHRTILYSGRDSHCGQTIQKIKVNDPFLQCVEKGVENEAVVETKPTNQKKYQCAKCKQLFDQVAAFKQHMVAGHQSQIATSTIEDSKGDGKFKCGDCGKVLKTQKKYYSHCLGHGDPNLECGKCHKVFASRLTLKYHQKIHQRKYECTHCRKSFCLLKEIRKHIAKNHFIFFCEVCDYSGATYSELKAHMLTHEEVELKQTGEDSYTLLLDENTACDSSMLVASEEFLTRSDEDQTKLAKLERADFVIAKVMESEIFMAHSQKAPEYRRIKKNCNVCSKAFNRIGDLKRHLIEHVVKSTLAKTPVNQNGTLIILCEICQARTFLKVDKYKAHLREHAKLTIYTCTFCDKSFSDSSNFSKHKKIHAATSLQCDLCQRKFNSKNMLVRHMEYHNNNSPIYCCHCNKQFHFRSMLNKHIKCAHNRETLKFRCKFCAQYFKALKDKWEHEWVVHNVRKLIVDCLICGSKFRKYSELKRHCSSIHNIEIPPAKKLLKKKHLVQI